MSKNSLLYISDTYNNRIRKIDSIGIIHTAVGTGIPGVTGDGGPPDSATIDHPSGIAFDTCGNLYIANVDIPRIRKVWNTITDNPITSITASLDTVCAGQSVTYVVATSGGGINTVFQWFKNDTAVSAATSNTYTYAPAPGDSIKCVVTSWNNCSYPSRAVTQVMHTIVEPLITPSVVISGPASAAIGAAVTITATVSGAGSSYSVNWLNHGVFFASTSAATVTYTKTLPVDSISATISAAEGACFDSTNSNAQIVAMENTSTQLVSAPIGGITVYPNPATSQIHVSTTVNIESIVITNLLGQEVYHGTPFNGNSALIDVHNLPEGVYFVKVNNIFVDKFIKE